MNDVAGSIMITVSWRSFLHTITDTFVDVIAWKVNRSMIFILEDVVVVRRILEDVLGVQSIQGSWNSVHHGGSALPVLTVTGAGVAVDLLDLVEDESSTNDDDNS